MLKQSAAWKLFCLKDRNGKETLEIQSCLSPDELTHPSDPLFVDLEVTTRCQLACPHCARTLNRIGPADMSLDAAERLLDMVPQAIQVTLVGLGEPLLYPHLDGLLVRLAARGIRTFLVTNAAALDKERSSLLASGLVRHVTFSIDTLRQDRAHLLRPGTDVERLKKNIYTLVSLAAKGSDACSFSIFSVLHRENMDELPRIARFAASLNIPALVLSHLNFTENRPRSLELDRSQQLTARLEAAMRDAASAGVALVGPNILDELDMESGWMHHILTRAGDLFKPQGVVRRCLNPLKTLVIRVDGSVDFCNCMPGKSMGRLHGDATVGEIWRGSSFAEQRRRVYFGPVPEECRFCPRR